MTHNEDNPGDHRDFAPDDPEGNEDEVLRSSSGDEEKSPDHPEASEVSAASGAGEARRGDPLEFKTYRYKGWLPSRRLILGKEVLAAFITAVVVYLFLSSLFVAAGFFGVPLEFLDPPDLLDPLAEYGLLRLDLIALLAGVYVLLCRVRYRFSWRKHLLGGK